jgi:cytochrome P450
MLLTLLSILVILLLLVFVIIYFNWIHPGKNIYDIFRAQGVNGEPFVPFFGQIAEINRYRDADMLMTYHEELVKKYGNVYLFSIGPGVRLVVNEPDLLADVFSQNNAHNYIKPPTATTIFTPIIGHHNLLVAEGDEHERARRMINSAFHPTSLKSMVSIITDRTAKTIQAILNKSDSSQEQQVDLQVLFNSLTLSIIASSAFGADLETNANAKDIMSRVLSDAMDAIIYRTMRMINQIPFLSKLPFWKKDIIDNGARKISEFVDQIIIDRRQGRSTSMSDGSDLLDLLLSAVDDDGQPFTDQEIKEQALTFVLAGSETTGNLMVWIFYILMTHDDVLQACQEEVDRVLPNGMEPTNEHLSELAVCEAIINETLRLYPSAPIFVRHCIREHTIGTERQLHIPVGADITINSYVLHRRSDLWPRPLEFDYTRWMRDPKTGLKPKLPHPFAYLPFAAGPRNCIGQNFALLEARLMLAMLVQRCNFKIIPGQKIVPDLIITLRTKYGLLANITKRQM